MYQEALVSSVVSCRHPDSGCNISRVDASRFEATHIKLSHEHFAQKSVGSSWFSGGSAFVPASRIRPGLGYEKGRDGVDLKSAVSVTKDSLERGVSPL